ncbi:MAG: M1 family peptidase [Bacteroidetes bacterium]|nr:MAG: M1 family peptidase [Bacteroidota bacterium]
MISKNTIFLLLLLWFTQGCKNITESEKELDISLDNNHESTHSFANAEEVAVKHLFLNLNLSFDSSTLSGYAEWDLTPGSASKRLVLDTRDLHIDSVWVNGQASRFVLGKADPVFGAGLFIPIDSLTQAVRIYYTTDPNAAALQWLKPSQTSGGKYPFLYSQSQAILARSWVPCMDLPSVRFTYDARITVPSFALPLMSASNALERNDSNVYHFKMEQPIPSYLLALSAGNLEFKSLGNSDRVGVFAEPEALDKAIQEFETLPQMVEAAEELYGPYQWGRYDVLVLPASFPFGGMENPRVTFATPTIIAGDGSLVSLLAHELAHSWSGNLVTNRTWNDFWLNEGFTVYFEQRIMEKVYGKDYADMLTVLGYGDLHQTLEEFGPKHPDTHLYLNLEGRDPDDGVGDVAYEKGRFFLRHCESVLGRERFDAFLSNYFTSHRFQTMTTTGFLELLKAECKEDEGLWKKIDAENWIYQSDMPDYFTPPTSVLLKQVETVLPELLLGNPKAFDLAKKWSTHEKLYLIRQLTPGDTQMMANMNAQFSFNTSTNSEIAFAWYMLGVKSNYRAIEEPLHGFLNSVGRRKFIAPLYKEMMASEYYKTKALPWYTEARPGYHAVSTQTIDEVLQFKP